MANVIIETNKGKMSFELYDKEAPATVANFLKLANEKFYDGLGFHRVIANFMVQGGCPHSRAGASGMAGTGGPGYMIKCEINENKHQAGSLSMAHAGKDTGGSQFFICHKMQPHLDGVHTVFGRTHDMDVVNALRKDDTILSVTVS